MSEATSQVRYLGFVFSTSECGVAAIRADGREAYASTPIEGRVTWQGWPAHYLEHTPEMMVRVLDRLEAKGFPLDRKGTMSASWRQHDLAVLDDQDAPLAPAPSWQCNGATEETRTLNQDIAGFAESVGTIEPRFVAAKLPWMLGRIPEMRRHVHRALLSGDWLAGKLTGSYRLSASDAICNGLLDQRTKALATDALKRAGRKLGKRLDPAWFPEVIASDGIVGRVRTSSDPRFAALSKRLRGWKVAAALGDNQATAAGCGAADHGTIVISLGTSGTVNRVVPMDAPLRGRAACFEYWDDRLLLMMLPACASWYEIFRATYATDLPHDTLNERALRARLAGTKLMSPPPDRAITRGTHRWKALEGMKPSERIASVQLSIAAEMLARVRAMLREVKGRGEPVRRFILTGGLAQAPLIEQALVLGLDAMAPGASIEQSRRRGPLAFKTDALGALYNARMSDTRETLAGIAARESKTKRCRMPDTRRASAIRAALGID